MKTAIAGSDARAKGPSTLMDTCPWCIEADGLYVLSAVFAPVVNGTHRSPIAMHPQRSARILSLPLFASFWSRPFKCLVPRS